MDKLPFTPDEVLAVVLLGQLVLGISLDILTDTMDDELQIVIHSLTDVVTTFVVYLLLHHYLIYVPQRTRLAERPALTRREHEVFDLVGEGLSNAQISKRLVISVRTVEAHLDSIRQKLSLKTRDELVQRARGQG